MRRKDNKCVDFGIWNISPSILSCPLVYIQAMLHVIFNFYIVNKMTQKL